MKYKTQCLEDELYQLMEELYPLCRSITGEGVRETLKILRRYIPIELKEVSSGTVVYDWTVPKEWKIRGAWIKYENEERHIIDFENTNLHIMSYSRPVHMKMTFKELDKHLYYIEDHPDWIPYLTTYYNDNWGICMSYNHYMSLDRNKTYEVCIDSELMDGFLTYGELLIQGRTKDEFLISTYLCHPSLCNDNLSGIVVSTYLSKILMEQENLKYSYRFVFVPETIGAITWLALNEGVWCNIKFGLVATCLGDRNRFCYKKSRNGNEIIDKATIQALKELRFPYKEMDYYPGGSDERQYGSLGINIPVGSLTRGLYVTDHIPPQPFEEYHSSADNLEFISRKALNESLNVYLKVVHIIENNQTYISMNPKCEPCLGKRGLYSKVGSQKMASNRDVSMRYLMCYSDGKHDLIDIANMLHVSFDDICDFAKMLEETGLLRVFGMSENEGGFMK